MWIFIIGSILILTWYGIGWWITDHYFIAYGHIYKYTDDGEEMVW